MDGLIIDGRFLPGRTANAVYGTQSPRRLKERGIDAEPHFDHGKHLYWFPVTRGGARNAERMGLREVAYPKTNTTWAEAGAA
jgi:hypothetical protein